MKLKIRDTVEEIYEAVAICCVVLARRKARRWQCT